jgi:hypothetical protein
MSTQPQLSPLEQFGKSVGQDQTTPPSQPQGGNLSPLEQLGQSVNQQQQPGQTPNADEQNFLNNNPGYQYLPKDPQFPNRQPGVYPAGPGNEWRNDPNHPMHDITQLPVDVLGAGDLAKETAGWGATSAALAASPILLGPAETFVATPAGKALLDVVGKYGSKVAQGAGMGIGYEAFHKAAKLLGLVSEK